MINLTARSANMQELLISRVQRMLALILFSFGVVGALPAETPTTRSQPQDCGPFVQQFYNWYVGKEKALMKRNSRESASSFMAINLLFSGVRRPAAMSN